MEHSIYDKGFCNLDDPVLLEQAQLSESRQCRRTFNPSFRAEIECLEALTRSSRRITIKFEMAYLYQERSTHEACKDIPGVVLVRVFI